MKKVLEMFLGGTYVLIFFKKKRTFPFICYSGELYDKIDFVHIHIMAQKKGPSLISLNCVFYCIKE